MRGHTNIKILCMFVPEFTSWIFPVRNMGQCAALLNAVINLHVPRNVRNFSTSCHLLASQEDFAPFSQFIYSNVLPFVSQWVSLGLNNYLKRMGI